MKKFVFFMFAILAMCFSAHNVKADESSPVHFSVWTNNQTKEIILQCDWGQYKGVEVQFFWGMVPGSYIYSSPIMEDTNVNGTITFHISNYMACWDYSFKLVFTDLTTGDDQELYSFITTPGNQEPEINKVEFKTIGYNFVDLYIEADGQCNGFTTSISCGEFGKPPIFQFEDWDYGECVIQKLFYGLDPYKNYEIRIKLKNDFGESTQSWLIQTMSNLPPEIETGNAYMEPNGFYADFMCYIDPKNTSTEYRIEYGEDIYLSESTSWFQVFNGKGNYTTGTVLKAGTTYYWRAVARNEFGQDEGEIKIFKTPGTNGIEDNIENKFSVYPNPATNKINVPIGQYAICDITGKEIMAGVTNGLIEIEKLPQGIYLFKNNQGIARFLKK